MEISKIFDGDIANASPTNNHQPTDNHRPSKATLLTIPGELRNIIYHLYFHSFFFPNPTTPIPNLTQDVAILRPLLPLLSTTKLIRHEAASILWQDYIPLTHWNFGAKREDTLRFLSFLKAMRPWTLSVDLTFQTRLLNTTNLDQNLAWILVRSEFTDEEGEEMKAERERWEAAHGSGSVGGGQGFFYGGFVSLGSCGTVAGVKYCYCAPEFSWVRVRGELGRLDWEGNFEGMGAEMGREK